MLEGLSDIVSMLGSAVTGVAVPLIGVLMYRDFKKRTEAAKAKQAEASAKATEIDNINSYAQEWKELYEKKEERVNQLEAKIEELYGQIGDDRQRIRELTEENTRLKLDNVTYRCEKLDCGLRIPPNAYTPKGLKNGELRIEN